MTEIFYTPPENPSFQDEIDDMSTFSNFENFHAVFENAEQLRENIMDLLESLCVDEDTLPQYLEDDCDFWNNENCNGSCFCDLIEQWADDQVDIYDSDIWKNAIRFIDFEDTYYFERGSEAAAAAVKKGGITKLLQRIQYTAYYHFACKVLALLGEL